METMVEWKTVDDEKGGSRQMTYTDCITVYRGTEIPQTTYKHKRDCYRQLRDYMLQETPPVGKICAIYGLRRTGKTIMMLQCIDEMSEEDRRKSAYLLCQQGCDMYQLRLAMDELLKSGICNFFIDEITEVEDFQVYGNVLSDGYTLKGAKIAIAGTDSLGIRLAAMNILFDRMEVIHTSHISFAEFSRLLDGKGIEQYIEFGGTLTDRQYKTIQSRDDYVNSAIVTNILHSLEKNEEVRNYHPALTELYDNQELVSVLNKMINKYSYYVALKAINKCFKSAPLYSTIHNMSGQFEAENIDAVRVNQATKEALHIKDLDEMETSLKPEDLEELKTYLKELDLFLQIPCYKSLAKMQRSQDLEIITQPGMIYAHATELMKVLSADEYWNQACEISDRREFNRRADNFVKGILLENIILSETYLWLQSIDKERYYVSQINVILPESMQQVEADLVIVDTEAGEAHLFEIKFSDQQVEEQTKHLQNEEFISYVNQNFGTVKSRSVIYNGIDTEEKGMKYINAETYLCRIHEMKLDRNAEFDKLLDASVKTDRKKEKAVKKAKEVSPKL